MNRGRLRGTPRQAKGRIIGSAVAALLLIFLAVAVSRLVVLWCPRGEDCERDALFLFWSGLLVSAVMAGAAGLAVRDLVDRWAARRSL